MHSLYGLQQMAPSFTFTRVATSLSRGLGIIERFSGDIDIRIEPPTELNVAVNPNKKEPRHRHSRKDFYCWLANKIVINGITTVEPDANFDDTSLYCSGSILLQTLSNNQ